MDAGVGGDTAGERSKGSGSDLASSHIDDRPDPPMPGRCAECLDGQRRHGYDGCADTGSECLGGCDSGPDTRERARTDVDGHSVDVMPIPTRLFETEVDSRDHETNVSAPIHANTHGHKRSAVSQSNG